MKFKMVIGDWSEDGHNRSKDITFESNYTLSELRQAYKNSCKLTGVQFNHNENYCGTTDYYEVCTNYQEGMIEDEVIEIFKKFDSNIDFENCSSPEEFSQLLMWFISLSMPKDFEYIMILDEIPYLNGYWNSELNVQFGYGLFD